MNHDFTRYRVYRSPSLWRRLCKTLDAHPLVVLFLLVSCSGVAVLLAKMIRHMAFGIW